jgi:hypothetical protein
MVVGLRTGSLGEEAISTMFWIPQIKKPFSGDSCTHVPSEDCPISTRRKRISTAYTVTVKDEPAIDTNQPTNGLTTLTVRTGARHTNLEGRLPGAER